MIAIDGGERERLKTDLNSCGLLQVCLLSVAYGFDCCGEEN